ncbi:Hypothetical protein HDN1F_24160 [gamma proteobacterium HdN1]|nr:Hypothetical protein HDN1F_24160 [gamma proteobacterium HdN1]
MKVRLRPSFMAVWYGLRLRPILQIESTWSRRWKARKNLRFAIRNAEVDVPNGVARITASFGLLCSEDVVCSVAPDALLENLLLCADRALYVAKEQGCDQAAQFKGSKVVSLYMGSAKLRLSSLSVPAALR